MIGLYDVHSHIIPKVDDGADSLETAMLLLKREYQDGVRTIYLTPHFRKNMFETSEEEIIKAYHKVKLAAKKEFPELTLFLGCEFHASMDMTDILKQSKCKTMGNSSYVLIEFSQKDGFQYIQERCYTLLSNGYEPIIAHAERYPILYKKMDYLEQLAEMGVWIQINADSILGLNGLKMKWFCRKLVKMGLLHLVGSDAHNMENRQPLMRKCAAYLEKSLGQEYAHEILIKNPQKINGEGEIYEHKPSER